MTTAVTYARYSSDRQRPATIADQQRVCHERATAEGWQVIADFADERKTGVDNKRPQYLAMQAAAQRGEFNVLIVDDLSRLSRDVVDSEVVIRRLEFAGIRVIACADGYDTGPAHAHNEARTVVRLVKGITNSMFRTDHAKRVHRSQRGQALQARWLGGRPFGYKLKPILDSTKRDPYGNPARIGTLLEIDPAQAKVVEEIFTRYAEGQSCGSIARELNSRSVASPGSTWARKTRRCRGWVESSVRVILQNPLYTGRQHWNTCKFVEDPDRPGKQLRRARPVKEHVINQVESLRIISDPLFEAAQSRTKRAKNTALRLKMGGRPKYLLSGLLKCGKCGANYQMGDAHKYACDSYLHGGTALCSNGERVRRDRLEEQILGPIREELLAPERIAKMAAEMEAEVERRARQISARASAVPAELAALDARLARLRARLQAGDPDLTEDELQAAIERAQAKRRELEAATSGGKATGQIFAMLPRAADLYRKQIAAGLDGDPQAALKARVLLRDLLGPIELTPGIAKGELWAKYQFSPATLIKAVAGNSGRGDRI